MQGRFEPEQDVKLLALERVAVEIRVRGRVQGVGFRPTVWRLARELGLRGEVLNDAQGVLIRVGGGRHQIAVFIESLQGAPPPLAQIEAIETLAFNGELPDDFRIAKSVDGAAHTQISPDAAICAACAAETLKKGARRYRYPFTNCTHCGPRLTIIHAIPYDRSKTTMAPFAMCDACLEEYSDPADRRFHAEPTACPLCGPQAQLIRLDGGPFEPKVLGSADALKMAANCIQRGEIVAVKGLGGYQIACDATNEAAVARLRQSKMRYSKPFALMARDLDIIRRYCTTSFGEVCELTSRQAPIVLLRADGKRKLPEGITPGLGTLGFMLPTTPLHLVLLRDLDFPVVMTSGNFSDEPQIVDDDQARAQLCAIARYALIHNRAISNRLDDSVVRVMAGKARLLRRARGYAPAAIDLPAGFETAPEVLAMGGELKATFCLVKDKQAILSQHQGDLENAATFDDYRKGLALYRQLFDHAPAVLVIDRHPEYLSSKFARVDAQKRALSIIEVQHHHAHVASCLAENGYALGAPPVLGIVLDGLGFGDEGAIWGGEFLLADYCDYERLARLKPIAMPGGAQAVREPWRNLYAHLMGAMGWNAFSDRYSGLELHAYLMDKPRAMLDAMIAKGINAPMASSCGRLFDAVAAALGACRERQAYEGEAAARLETLAEAAPPPHDNVTTGYPLNISRPSRGNLLELDPAPMWNAILLDLERGVAACTMALQFHKGLSQAVVDTAKSLALGGTDKPRFDTVVLSGGCFQNRILFEGIASQLSEASFTVLSHARVPANDGGLSLGQAIIGAARLIKAGANTKGRDSYVSRHSRLHHQNR